MRSADADSTTPSEQGQEATAEVSDQWALVLARKLDVNVFYAREAVKAATKGDAEAAREVLRDYVWAIDQYTERTWNGATEWAYARYLADCFRAILEKGTDPKRALNLRERVGRRRGGGNWNTEALGAAYWLLVRGGIASERATELLSEELDADRRTIQRAARMHGNEAFARRRLVDGETLKVIAKPYAAAIGRIFAADKEKSR